MSITQCLETLQKDYCSTISTYHSKPKKIFHLKDSTKNSIKAMDISSLLNTDLGNLNDSSLILKDDCPSMCNANYIFLKFHAPFFKKYHVPYL